ncbi:MAG TPA: RNA polymerase sigma factor SigJ [Longimicrobiales bacterium]|nr:RNA polymerase sigma factor SigJ [Longimicrobiales bacterium]
MTHDELDEAGQDQSAAAVFAAHRERLWGIAYGILGSPDDADDLVQEAYLRWHRTDRTAVRHAEAWLVTTTTRLGIDRLRARQVERRHYVGPWLPTPVVDPSPRPDRGAEIASELSVAFLVLMERLAPEERAAFLLRDVFDVEYRDIARVLDRGEAACRQVVRRARTRVRADAPRFRPSTAEIEAMARQFSAAVAADDYTGLLALLSPDASFLTDGGGKAWAARNVVRSADRVARCVLGVARKRGAGGDMEERLARVNGEPGIVTYQDGKAIAATMFSLQDGRIRSIYRVLNPDKLSAVPALHVLDAQYRTEVSGS